MTAREGPPADTASRVRTRWRASAPPPEGRPPAARLPAKLRPPQARVHLVERRALLHALGDTAAPLVVLCAPAGSGKTTVLRQWAEADARPFAWVQLDEADRDPVVLLTYLAMALESVTEVDPSVRASLSLAVPPVRGRAGAPANGVRYPLRAPRVQPPSLPLRRPYDTGLPVYVGKR